MKKIIVALLSLSFTLFTCEKAFAYGHANRYGGSSSHSWGSSSHTNAYGGSTSHAFGEGTSHTRAHRPNPAHRAYGGSPHTNPYGGTAKRDARNGGAATGNAGAAKANTAAANANIAAARSPAAAYTMGQMVATLPPGCITPDVNGQTYFLCGNTWFSAAYGASGVYYRVVPTP